MRKEIFQSQRPGETPSRAEGQWGSAHTEPGAGGWDTGQGRALPHSGQRLQTQRPGGNCFQTIVPSKAQGFVQELKDTITQRYKIQNACQPSKQYEARTAGNGHIVRRKSVRETAPDVGLADRC